MADLERIYVVPFRSVYDSPRTRRSRKAVKTLRSFISRHMKAEESEVAISEGVNRLIWKRGIQKPPRKIKVRAVKSGDRVVVSLLDEKVDESKAEVPKTKEKKEQKPPEQAKEKGETPAEKKEKKPGPAKEEKAPEPKKEEKKEPEKKPEEEEKPAEKAPEKKE
ncbi:hypothetical protein GF412_01800 [Candidatus Micrarchaeota archaeon]|nr:hypothetical protein [Candidatus Micrarchaeota archaeon]MBD3417696.1 hypothetical protein [Candidatus Micrarchaeota archaeon]